MCQLRLTYSETNHNLYFSISNLKLYTILIPYRNIILLTRDDIEVVFFTLILSRTSIPNVKFKNHATLFRIIICSTQEWHCLTTIVLCKKLFL